MRFAPKEWWLGAKEFVKDTRSEMKKVTWPTRPEIISTTGVVLAAVVFFGIYLFLCDVAFSKAIDSIFIAAGASV